MAAEVSAAALAGRGGEGSGRGCGSCGSWSVVDCGRPGLQACPPLPNPSVQMPSCAHCAPPSLSLPSCPCRTRTSTAAPPASAGSRRSGASSSGPLFRLRWVAPVAFVHPCACVNLLARDLSTIIECACCAVYALQFAPGPPPYCMDSELPSSSSRGSSGCPSPASSVATQRRPASATRRALEGAGVAAALRQDPAPMSGGGGSFSYGAAPGSGAPAGGVPRPSTAPAQRQYPWSWQT